MKTKSFTELHNIRDIVIEQIRNETDITLLIELMNELWYIKNQIRKKQREVIRNIQKEKNKTKLKRGW